MKQPVISFEFFPPKTEEGIVKLRAARQQLAQLNPKFFSVTFGAGGSTRDRTMETVLEIHHEGFEAAPHISCISSSREEVCQLLDAYRTQGIRHLVALRGDIPSGTVGVGDFRHANELVAFIRQETGEWFEIEVAAYPEFHPEARSPGRDLEYFKLKVEAGANAAITQYFYNVDAYFNFMDQCGALGITIPVVPGIMPIYNYTQLSRFSDVCGAEIPRWLKIRLQDYADDLPSLRSLGTDVVTDLCEQLLAGGAPGLHFYTLNQAGIISTIMQRLGLPLTASNS
ncbi:MAG TPA: methylenetetrahydrofolate reductase [NAD(P)H] [Methylophilaceae bacterium]|nr:methylenetetrahydrofolate reductase [NAD(P)H] [Methylophilaceae bacterium]